MRPHIRLSPLTDQELRRQANRLRALGQNDSIIDELIDRREAAQSDFAKIERSLAYSNAESYLSSNLPDAPDACGEWLDNESQGEDNFGLDQSILDAIAYLEARGLIERDTAHPAWIAIRNESEDE